jgi:hypothetical protein
MGWGSGWLLRAGERNKRCKRKSYDRRDKDTPEWHRESSFYLPARCSGEANNHCVEIEIFGTQEYRR